MSIILDLMEYANDAAARAAFVTNATAPDLCTGGSASAVSVYGGGYEADKAFDNNADTLWHSAATGLPFWIEYDFGSGVTKIINGYTIQVRASGSYYWVAFKLRGSNNYSSWDDLDTQTGQSFTGGEKKTYTLATPNTTAYRYYRFYITDVVTSGDGYTHAAELELMESMPLQDYSEATIKQEGSYALKGIAAITASLNKTLTRTVSPTIDLTNKYFIKFNIRASRTGSNIKIGIHDSGGTTTEITPNILAADTWQTVVWDISAVSNANKDAINSIIITIVNADADNVFYIDNMFADVIVTISPSSIISEETFGTPKLTLKILPAAIVSAEAFGVSKLTLKVLPEAIVSSESFGISKLILKVLPASIASSEALGTPKLILKIIPAAISSLAAFGTPKLILKVLPASIVSGEAFGVPTITQGNILFPASIISSESFGVPKLTLKVLPASIVSEESFGTPYLLLPIYPASIVSEEVFGVPKLTLKVFPASITSTEAFGRPSIFKDNITHIPCTISISSLPRIKSGAVLTAVGDVPDQALYWELLGLDPDSGEEGPGLGSLRWNVTRTDASCRAVNLYQSPTDPAYAGRTERIKLRRVAA